MFQLHGYTHGGDIRPQTKTGAEFREAGGGGEKEELRLSNCAGGEVKTQALTDIDMILLHFAH